MKRKLNEWFSVLLAKNPGRMILFFILLFNLVFFLISSVFINGLSLNGTDEMSFFESVFYTVTMVLDAGCISYVIADIGSSGVLIALICLAVVLVGMVSFTGAVIGYITNYISTFIEKSNDGHSKLIISGHFVILNWNTRASEIVNDLLYTEKRQKVVVLVNSRKDEIKKEIDESLSNTVAKENAVLLGNCREMPFLKKMVYMHKHSMKKRIDVIVREGDVFSLKQLRDISIENAESIVILGNDINNSICKYEMMEREDEKGNSQTIKTLMQVIDITSANYSRNDQKIIVEITDAWTEELVDKIIKRKQVDAKCTIVPLRINEVLGQLLSQFSLMPELNLVYKELFSNKGATFFSEECKIADEEKYIRDYFENHRHAIPLTSMESGGKKYFYYDAAHAGDTKKVSNIEKNDCTLKVNSEYRLEKKHVIILGHNSKCEDIMRGFTSFNAEWHFDKIGEHALDVVIIDDEKSLEKANYYKNYPFVDECVSADIYDKDKICKAIDRIVTKNENDTSILILSDDSVSNEYLDTFALANLVYVQEIIAGKIAENPNFDVGSIDVIVEIIDPKHYDIVSSYSVNNVVISNRFISKMITQIGEKKALFDFYNDILSYDTDAETTGKFDSKEIYIKKVSAFFETLPEKCTADVFVRTLYDATAGLSNPTLALGYVRYDGSIELFCGDLSNITVELEESDKLIVFSSH